MPEILTSWDAPATAAAEKPMVLSSWEQGDAGPSTMQRAAVAAEPVLKPALSAASYVAGIPAGLAETLAMGVPWAGTIAAGVTGVESSLAALMKGEPAGPAFYKGYGGAQQILDEYVNPLFEPQTRFGQDVAAGFGKAAEGLRWLGERVTDITGRPEAGAILDAAGQVLVIPKVAHIAIGAVPFAGGLLASHMAKTKRAAAPEETMAPAEQMRAVRPQETPETPVAAPPAPETQGTTQPAAPSATRPEFNPEPVWKPIPPDAVVPPGLEFRTNPQTGQHEARVLPPAPAAPPRVAPAVGGLPRQVMAEWGPVQGAVEAPRAWVKPTPEAPPAEPAIPAPAGAPLFIPPKGEAPAAPRHAVGNLPVLEVPLADLRLSEEVPQFKKDANVHGVVSPLGGKFDRVGVAPIQVWERRNGNLEIISGRHRFDLAKRSGEESMPAQIHREADGFTAKMAARLDAELNIRDEQGSIADYANYFRESGLAQDEAAANAAGLLARAKGRTGFSIARDASPEVYAAHSAGLLSDEAAHEIARAAPGDGSLQAVGLKLVNENKPITLAVNTMRALSLMPREGAAKPEQGDIFGFDDSLIKEQLEVAKRAAAAQREIREQIAAVSGATKRPEIARKLGVDVKDPKAVSAKIAELRAESERMQNWPLYPDLVQRFGGHEQVATPSESAPVSEEQPFVDTQTQAMFQKRAPYNADQTKLFEEKPALTLKGETEAEIRQREAEAKAAKDKAEAEQRALAETARQESIRKEIASRSQQADFALQPTEAVDRKTQAEADRRRAEADLAGQSSLFQERAKYGAESEPKPWYYSEIARAVEASPMKQGSAKAWQDYIKSRVGKGVKNEEIEATGINDWLATQEAEYEALKRRYGPDDADVKARAKVTKEQVQAFMEQGGVKVTETAFGVNVEARQAQLRLQDAEQAVVDQARKEYFDTSGARDYALDAARDQLSPSQRELMSDQMRPLVAALRAAYAERNNLPDSAPPRFEEYQLPGSVPGSYRELVLTLPEKPEPPPPQPTPEGLAARKAIFDKYQPEIDRLDNIVRNGATGRERNAAVDEVYRLEKKRDAEADAAYMLPADSLPPGYVTIYDRTASRDRQWAVIPEDQPHGMPMHGRHATDRAAILDAVRYLANRPKEKPADYFESGHFPSAGNYLAHTRVNDRILPDGRKVLFVEEIQSDRAQKGRTEGFGNKPRYTVVDKNGHVRGDFATPEDAIAYAKNPPEGVRGLIDENSPVREVAASGIAPAPFVTKTDSWTALVLKRLLRYAAEGNYDAIAWTRGEQQVERYTNALRKHVDVIEWKKTPEGVQIVGYKSDRADPYGDTNKREAANAALRRNDFLGFDGAAEARSALLQNRNDWSMRWGDLPMSDAEIIQAWLDTTGGRNKSKVVDTTEKESALSDAIGKSMADKIRNDPNQTGTIEGENITVSDTGMAGYYDRIVPKVAAEVAKKVGGGKVGEISLTIPEEAPVTSSGDAARAERLRKTLAGEPMDQSKQQAIEITPAMREKIMAGQALFQPKADYVAREKIRGQAPEGQLDLFSEVPVKGADLKAFEHVVVEPEKVGEHKVSFDQVRNAPEAASVFQELNRSPMEKFQALGLDANDKPVAFFDLFSGTLTQTSVYPRELWTAVYQTPGVRKLWIAHQHPSGVAEPSHADKMLTRSLQAALTPDIGIELKGHLIVTPSKSVDIGPDGSDYVTVMPRPSDKSFTIPILERKIQSQQGARDSLSSPAAVRDFLRKLAPDTPGLLIMDAQNRALGWWPMQVHEMAKLRTGSINSGMAALMRKVGRNNPAAAIAYSPGPTTPEFQDAVRNIGTALSLADVRMVDAMTIEPVSGGQTPMLSTGQMRSAAERGESLVNHTVNFNIGLTPQDMAKGVGAVADAAKAVLARAQETKLGAAASEWGRAVVEDLQIKIAPMAAGTDPARAITKDFANADRLARYQWARLDDIIKKSFTPEQQRKMWDAAEEENMLRQDEVPAEQRAGRGLDKLTPEERQVMDELQQYGDALLQRARDVGMFTGEGVKYWVPRMVAAIGEDGAVMRPTAKNKGIPGGPGRSPYTSPVGGNISTQASSLKQRKYATAAETEEAMKLKFGESAYLARNIRTMPMAMARIERAIASKELINSIKEFGKTSGQELVVDSAKDGYFTIDHPAFKTYRYRPDVKFTEAWDKNMWDQMNAFAADIGVDAKRVLSMRGQKWGEAGRGGDVRTRFGGPETVLTHELGHQLDFKYGLIQRFFGGDRPKSDFILQRQIAKAEREGDLAKADKLKTQMAINEEMRNLADLRFEGAEVSDYYRKYVRKGTEKMANMVHAYVHAPEKFRAVAPTAYQEFSKFLTEHPELSRLQKIKPSLTLGTGTFYKRPPGEDFDVFPIYVSKEFEGPLKAVMSDVPGHLYKSMMALKGKTMSVIMYSPLIHNGVEWGRAMPLMPGKILTFKTYFDGNVAKNDPQIMTQAIKEGYVPIGKRFFMQDITGILEDPMLQPGRSWTAKAIGGTVGLVNKGAGEAVKKGIDAAGDFWHNTLLWDRIGDLQAGIYIHVKADLIKKGTDPLTAGRMAAHMANRYAGALPNEAMSSLARKAANFAFFSRTFTFGNLGVMKDMMTGLPRDVQAQIARDAGEVARFAAQGESQKIAIKAFATDIALMYAANSALQSGFDYLKRDQSLDEIERGYVERWERMLKRVKESPSDLLKPFEIMESLTPLSENEPGKEYRVHMGNDEGGTGIYVRLPTGKIGEEFLEWGTSPLDMLKRKQGTVARPLIQMMTNDKGFGRRVYNPDAPGFRGAAKAVGNIAWNFFSSQFPTDSLESALDIARGHSEELDALKVIGPLFGVTFSKGAPGGPEVGQMFTMERQHRAEVSDAMPEIKKLIKHDKMDEAIERMHEAHMTPWEIKSTIRFASMPRARLTPRALRKFYLIAPPEERERMQRMRENRQ